MPTMPVKLKEAVHLLLISLRKPNSNPEYLKYYLNKHKVTSLDLSGCHLQKLDIQNLRKILAETGVTHLDLSHNQLNYKIMNVIAAMLGENTTLIDLNLSHNQIDFIASLANELRKNTTLQHLDLSYNQIDHISLGLFALAMEIAGNRNILFELNLHNNRLDSESSRQLETAISTFEEERTQENFDQVLNANAVLWNYSKELGKISMVVFNTALQYVATSISGQANRNKQ